MLKIRLQRIGRRNDPSFRMVVTESWRGPKSGKAIENLGFYNPKTKTRNIDAERIQYWMRLGAQLSDTVHNMLVGEKIIGGSKINVLPRKTPIVKEKEEVEEKMAVQVGSDTEEGSEKASAIVEKPDEKKEEAVEGVQEETDIKKEIPDEGVKDIPSEKISEVKTGEENG